MNIWNIEEYQTNGPNCPVIPVNLPWYKKAALFFFRFGVCPLCIASSVFYSVVKAIKTFGQKKPARHGSKRDNRLN